MSRKLIFAYFSVFLVFVVLTLAIVNPVLVGLPAAFSGVFLPLLGVTLAVHYALRNRSRLAVGLFNAFCIMAVFWSIAVIAHVGWAIFATFLVGLALGLVKREPKAEVVELLPVEPAHPIEQAARQELPWERGRGKAA